VLTRFNQATFDANGVASDPIFRTVDGSTCDQGMDLTTPAGRAQAFTLVTGKGLIRIHLAVPANAEFTVDTVANQYGCSDKSTLSMYRRPLPAANLRFVSTLMWDGRESSALTLTQDITKATNRADLLADLAHQAVDATLIHAQAASAPTPDQQKAIVNFEMALSVAQSSDAMAGIPLVCRFAVIPRSPPRRDDERSAFRHTRRALSFARFIFPPRIQTPWPCLARCNTGSAPKIAGSAGNG
jgi:hypothetical protein